MGPLRYVYAWWRELTWHKYPLRLRPISRDQRSAGTPLDLGRPAESADFDLAQGRGPHPGPSATIWADAVRQYRGHPGRFSLGRFASVPGLEDRTCLRPCISLPHPLAVARPLGHRGMGRLRLRPYPGSLSSLRALGRHYSQCRLNGGDLALLS